MLADQSPDVLMMREKDRRTCVPIYVDAAIKLAGALLSNEYTGHGLDYYRRCITRALADTRPDLFATDGLNRDDKHERAVYNARTRSFRNHAANTNHLVATALMATRPDCREPDAVTVVAREATAHQLYLLPRFVYEGAKDGWARERILARAAWLCSVTDAVAAWSNFERRVAGPWFDATLAYLLPADATPPVEQLTRQVQSARDGEQVTPEGTPIKSGVQALEAACDALACTQRVLTEVHGSMS